MAETTETAERFIVLIISAGEHLTATGTPRGRLWTSRDAAATEAARIERKHPLWRATVLQLFPKGAEEAQ